MRKKLMAAIVPLTALCLFAPITEAKADTEINTYAVEGSYKVDIPAEVTVNPSTNKGTLLLTGTLDACYNLEIGITSQNSYKLVNSQSSARTLNYTLSDDKVVFSKEEGSADTDLQAYDLTIRVKDKPVVSGEYTDTLTFTMNAKNYAQETKHKLIFDTNCSDDATVTISTTEKFVSENAAYGMLPTPKRTGYTFAGWYTVSSEGTEVTSESIMGTENTTVYAHWNPHVLTINYHNDGAEYVNWNNEKVPVNKDGVDKYQVEYYGQTFSNRTDGLYDSWRWDYRTGYSIKRDCWKIGRDGTKEYKDKGTGDTTTIEYAEYLDVLAELEEGDVTVELYPIWIAHIYTIQYDNNCADASGSTASSKHTYDVEQKLTKNGFSREGYTFSGWSTSTTGKVVYTDEQMVSNLTATKNATITLYAVWKANTSDEKQQDVTVIEDNTVPSESSDEQDIADSVENDDSVKEKQEVSSDQNQQDMNVTNEAEDTIESQISDKQEKDDLPVNSVPVETAIESESETITDSAE